MVEVLRYIVLDTCCRTPFCNEGRNVVLLYEGFKAGTRLLVWMGLVMMQRLGIQVSTWPDLEQVLLSRDWEDICGTVVTRSFSQICSLDR